MLVSGGKSKCRKSRKSAFKSMDDPEALFFEEDTSDEIVTEERLAQIRQGYSLLTDRQREAIELRLSGVKTAKAIGQQMGITEAVVYLHLRRATEKLASALSEYPQTSPSAPLRSPETDFFKSRV